MRVRMATESDRAAWDEFCAANGACYSSFFWWRDVELSLGRTPIMLVAEDAQGTICGCLPLCIKRGMGGKRAISGSMDTYGRPIVTIATASSALLTAADAVFAEHGVASVKMRPDMDHALASEVREALCAAGYHCKEDTTDETRVRHRCRIALGDFDTVWSEVMMSRARQETRKAIKMGVKVEEASLEEFCRPVFGIVVEVWQRLGNVLPAFRPFRDMLEAARHHTRMYLARVDGEVVGGACSIYAGEGCFLKLWVTRGDYSRYCVNRFTGTRTIEDACRLGMKFVDLGSTPPSADSGHHRWKSRFGAQSVPLLDFNRILRRLPNFIDSCAFRLASTAAPRLSHGGCLSKILGPVGRMVVNWARR